MVLPETPGFESCLRQIQRVLFWLKVLSCARTEWPFSDSGVKWTECFLTIGTGYPVSSFWTWSLIVQSVCKWAFCLLASGCIRHGPSSHVSSIKREIVLRCSERCVILPIRFSRMGHGRMVNTLARAVGGKKMYQLFWATPPSSPVPNRHSSHEAIRSQLVFTLPPVYRDMF